MQEDRGDILGIVIRQKGDWSKTKNWLAKVDVSAVQGVADRCGKDGVELLSKNTPRATGKTASSWYYEIEKNDEKITVVWKNSNIVDYVSIALVIQYGHASKNGSWIEGIDYINPAMKPLFEQMADVAWKEVTK